MRVAYFKKGILPQYKILCQHINYKIKENINNVPDYEKWFNIATYGVGMYAFYKRKRCYSGTQDVNVNQLIR